jgi:hypothetical protein
MSFAHVLVKSLLDSDAISSIQASLSLWPLWRWSMSTISSTLLMQTLIHLLKYLTKALLLVCWLVLVEICPTTTLVYLLFYTHSNVCKMHKENIRQFVLYTSCVTRKCVQHTYRSLIERTLQINEQNMHTHKWTKGKVHRLIWIKILKQF